MAEGIGDRATRYFGVRDTPRRTLFMGDATAVVVTDDHLFIYEEMGAQHGVSIKLTPTRRSQLIDALEGFGHV